MEGFGGGKHPGAGKISKDRIQRNQPQHKPRDEVSLTPKERMFSLKTLK
jgi:hypothetical protein